MIRRFIRWLGLWDDHIEWMNSVTRRIRTNWEDNGRLRVEVHKLEEKVDRLIKRLPPEEPPEFTCGECVAWWLMKPPKRGRCLQYLVEGRDADDYICDHFEKKTETPEEDQGKDSHTPVDDNRVLTNEQ